MYKIRIKSNVAVSVFDYLYRMKRTLLITTIIYGVFMCGNPDDKRPMDEIQGYNGSGLEVRNGDSVVIYWNPPQFDPDTVAYYELFYYTENDSTKRLLKKIISPVKKTELIVYRKDLPAADSIYFFAVRFVTGDGISSNFHSSSDMTSNPLGGWCLKWVE